MFESPRHDARALHSGSASAFQADSAGSIPAARSIPQRQPDVTTTCHALRMAVSFLRDTKSTGVISELSVMVALAKSGYRLLLPYGENCRYDVAIERKGEFKRVQIKTGRLRDGVIIFNAFSSHTHRGGSSARLYTDEVDLFGVYCRATEGVYLIPVDEASQQCHLRVEQPKNAQARKIRWASDFLIARSPEVMVVSFANHDRPAPPS